MADEQPLIKLLRSDLVAALGNNPRVIRAFENLLREVTVVLPGDNTMILGIAQEAQRNAEGLALGALGARQHVPQSIRAGDGIQSTQDAAGQTLAADPNYIRAFAPRPPATLPDRPVDDGSLMLAAQAFAHRPNAPIAQRPVDDGDLILSSRAFNRR